jgi:4-alpha-glucanotransferase
MVAMPPLRRQLQLPAVVPLQDLLCLGDEARFNSPGTTAGNWSWRLSGGIATITGPLQGLGEMARRYGRR